MENNNIDQHIEELILVLNGFSEMIRELREEKEREEENGIKQVVINF